MARKATLRASDDDRELVAERLRQATAEGRLLAHELEHRLGAALTARTYGELDSLVADLPSSGSDKPVRRGRRSHGLVPVGPAAALGLVLVIPIVVALVIAAVAIIASLFLFWAIIAALGWWVFGHRLRGNPTHYARRYYGYHRSHVHRGQPGPRGGSSPDSGWL